MSILIPFPQRWGSPPEPDDREWRDEFEWTDELLHEYANRAREIRWRLGAYSRLPSWPAGPPCQDCGRRTRRRVRYMTRLLCPDCGNARARVAAALEDLPSRPLGESRAVSDPSPRDEFSTSRFEFEEGASG